MWESVRYKNRKTNDRENHWNVRNESSLLPDDDEDRSSSANRIADLMLFHNEQPIVIFEVAFSQTKQNAINAAIGLLCANKFTKLAVVETGSHKHKRAVEDLDKVVLSGLKH
jgi:hypothetical protein